MAFVTHTLGARLTAPRSRAHVCTRRRAATTTPTMSYNDTETELRDATPPPAAASSTSPYTAPSLDTTAFSDFVSNAQTRIDDLVTRAQELDTAELAGDLKTNAIGLVDNLLAGDWLNRGELYGAVQLAFVFLLLRSPGVLDGLVGFVVGPATLIAGAALSGKALWDLGRQQLSIWPSPVPGAELKTEGIYAQIRHPIYAGLLLASLGFAVSTGSPERFALTLAMGAFLAKKIEVEEEFLAKTYDGWDDYCARVEYKLLPNVW